MHAARCPFLVLAGPLGPMSSRSLGECSALLEPLLTEAVIDTMKADASDPVTFLSARLASVAAGERGGATLSHEAEQHTDKWSAVSWLKGVGIHRVIATSLQAASPDASDEAVLAFLRQLPDRSALAEHLCTGAVLNSIVDLVWKDVETLKLAEAVTHQASSMRSPASMKRTK